MRSRCDNYRDSGARLNIDRSRGLSVGSIARTTRLMRSQGCRRAGVGIALFVHFVSSPRTLTFLCAAHVGKSVSPGSASHLPHAGVRILSARRRQWPPHHFPLTLLPAPPAVPTLCSFIGRTRRVGRWVVQHWQLSSSDHFTGFRAENALVGTVALQSPRAGHARMPGGRMPARVTRGARWRRLVKSYALKGSATR